MNGETIRIALLVLLALLLLTAAATDLRARLIPNRLNLAIAVCAPLFWLACGLPVWPDMALQLALAAGVFALFAGLFALGMMGGGDVKLLAAVALWFPWQALAALLTLMALLGGVVTIITLVHHRLARREGPPEVPYGVAIALAGLWLVGERIIYRFT